jgi:uncharacterized protein (TIGR03437 family)
MQEERDMRSVKKIGFRNALVLTAILVACPLYGVNTPEVFISVDTLGNGSLSGPAGVSVLTSSLAADPGPGGLGSVLTYTLLNPPSLVFGDVQLTGSSGVIELIRFNAPGTGNPNYPASLLFYSSPADGASHAVNTATPPATFYPNIVSVPIGSVYTPGPGQPGFVASILTHYTFQEPVCTYSLSPASVNISADGGNGSFGVITGPRCPITPATSSDFLLFTVAGTTVNYAAGSNPAAQSRTGTITVGGKSFTVFQAGAAVTFQPARLSFTSGPVTGPPSQTVSVSGAESSFFSASSDVPWAKVTANSTRAPAILTVTVSPAGLTPGTYIGNITLNFGGVLVSFPVTYTVQGLPSLVAVPERLAFFYTTGGALPATQLVSIYSTSPVVFQTAGAGFASVTPASGTTTQNVTVAVNPSNLLAGTYSVNVTVTAAGVTNSPLVVPVTLTVISNGPQFVSGAIVNSASFQATSIAPGSLFTVFGASLAGSNSPNGVSMTLGGLAVPLQYISPTQINAQAPFEIALGPQSLVLTVNNVSSTALVTIVPASPGIFQVNGRGAILNQNFSLNAPGNPALVGSTVQVYFTGQGLVTPAGVTGSPASATLARTNAITTATIGTQPATVTFSGLAPGFIGLAQANVIVPNLATNDYPLVLTVNGVASNAGTVAVKSP